MKITLVERKGQNPNYVYIEYVDVTRREEPFWCDFTIGSKTSEAKLYGPKAAIYKLALEFAGVNSFDQIPYGASYTEPQKPTTNYTEPQKPTTNTAESKPKTILVKGMDYGDEDQVVYYPAEYLPRPVFDDLYQAGAMYKDPELGTWVIDPERAKSAGYTCEMRQAKVTNLSLQDEIEG
jgi:hypothetical protein